MHSSLCGAEMENDDTERLSERTEFDGWDEGVFNDNGNAV